MQVQTLDIPLSKKQILLLHFSIEKFGNLSNFKTALLKELLTYNLTADEKQKIECTIKDIDNLNNILKTMSGTNLEVFMPLKKKTGLLK